MPRAKGHPIKAIRLNRNLVQFDLYAEGDHILKTVTVQALAAFLRGEVDADSNLVPQAMPVTLEDFANNSYIPSAAKPRFSNPVSFDAEVDLVKSVCKALGKASIHEIRPKDAERLKTAWLGERRANSTIKKRLCCLRRILDYGVAAGLIKQNLIPQPRGLPVSNRSSIWLRKDQIDVLLANCSPIIAPLVEFLALTGARVGEALDLQRGDIRNGKLWIPTEKRRRAPRDAMRAFETASLGPRFTRLMARLNPHPRSGYFFCAGRTNGKALSHAYVNRLFQDARAKAELGDLHPHDLRGTFAMHRAMVVNSFRQLQGELGHGDPKSVQSYLDRAQHLDARDSIFFVEPVPAPSPRPANGSHIPANEPQSPAMETPLLH